MGAMASPALCIARPLGEEIVVIHPDQVLISLSGGLSREASLNGVSKKNALATSGDLEGDLKKLRRYFSGAEQSGDERYLGYAESILSAWPESAPWQISLARARLWQKQHFFDRAADELNRVLRQDKVPAPARAEAQLLLAYMAITRGEFQTALSHCAKASIYAGTTLALICSARAQSGLGKLAQSYQNLKSLEPKLEVSSTEYAELLLSSAEFSDRSGDFVNAEVYWRTLLREQPEHILAFLSLLDFLLMQERWPEAEVLLSENQAFPFHPAIRLRTLLINTQLQRNENCVERENMQRYFQSQQLRNPNYASREYALYLLYVDQQPQKALQIAKLNWQEQRELADTRLLAHLARLQEDTDTLWLLRQWQKNSGYEDRALQSSLGMIDE